MSKKDKVIWEKIGHVALVKLNRPEVLNAIDTDVWEGSGYEFENFYIPAAVCSGN